MVDTWAATAAGAFALSENNLYTVEAFDDYLERLAPGGILSMNRWYQSPPDQLLRLVSLGRAALAARGERTPAATSSSCAGPRGAACRSRPRTCC